MGVRKSPRIDLNQSIGEACMSAGVRLVCDLSDALGSRRALSLGESSERRIGCGSGVTRGDHPAAPVSSCSKRLPGSSA